jgi:hypothetical protein
MAIGKDLLDVPFAELVRNLAFAIAEGQLELDRSSIATLEFLIANRVSVIPEVAEVIEPAVRTVPISGATGPQSIPVTGATVRASGAAPVEMTLLQAGLLPTFYQFTEASLEVKLSISMKETETRETTGTPLGRKLSRLGVLAFGSPVDYRTSNTYSYAAQGSSVLRATLRPVPPPPRLIPSTVTINTLTTPPTVSRNE